MELAVKVIEIIITGVQITIEKEELGKIIEREIEKGVAKDGTISNLQDMRGMRKIEEQSK